MRQLAVSQSVERSLIRKDLAKNIWTWIPLSLLSSLPISTHITVCIVVFLPCEPPWLPTSLLHLPSLIPPSNHMYKWDHMQPLTYLLIPFMQIQKTEQDFVKHFSKGFFFFSSDQTIIYLQYDSTHNKYRSEGCKQTKKKKTVVVIAFLVLAIEHCFIHLQIQKLLFSEFQHWKGNLEQRRLQVHF